MHRLTVAVGVLLLACLATGHVLYEAKEPLRGWIAAPMVPLKRNQNFVLTIGLKRRNMKEVDTIFWQVSNPKHPRYGNHLNSFEMRDLVSPGSSAVNTVQSWLASAGLVSVEVSHHEDWITVRDVSLTTLEKLFKVKFATYRCQKTHRVVARALGAVTIPDALKDIVEVVAGFRGFPAPKPVRKEGNAITVTPEILYQTYNLTQFPTNTNSSKKNIQAFAEFQGIYFEKSDMTKFCAAYLKDCKDCVCAISKVIGSNPPQEAGLESALDSEYITAMGRSTETWVFSDPQSDFCAGLMQWAAQVFSAKTNGSYPFVISMSYGTQSLLSHCKQDWTRLNEDVQKMGTAGISVIIASGDGGSGNFFGHLDDSFPAEIPYATAVGATTFISGNSGEERSTSWSGGGFAYEYSAPSYQQEAIKTYFATPGLTLPSKKDFNAKGRGTPDVSMLGEGFQVIKGGQTTGVAGTSCSTPSFAGFVSLLNNVRLSTAGKTLGFLNPLLYQNADLFTDITVGTNDQFWSGFQCAKGWDPVTGLGTPNMDKWINKVRSMK